MKKQKIYPDRCSWHTPHNYSFMVAYSDAEERMARGEKQKQCSVCLRWHWEDEMGTRPAEAETYQRWIEEEPDEPDQQAHTPA